MFSLFDEEKLKYKKIFSPQAFLKTFLFLKHLSQGTVSFSKYIVITLAAVEMTEDATDRPPG